MQSSERCVEFVGAKNRDGYGVLSRAVNGSRLAHRAALAEALGRPLEGIVLHSCDNPPCINPAHLREGTHADNIADAMSRGRNRGGRYDQTECKHGHPLVDGNVRHVVRSNGYSERICISCRRERNKKLSEARKAARHERGLLRQRKDAS